jgi:hypothetical protein
MNRIHYGELTLAAHSLLSHGDTGYLDALCHEHGLGRAVLIGQCIDAALADGDYWSVSILRQMRTLLWDTGPELLTGIDQH